MDDPDAPAKTESIDDVPELPARALATYARLWQLETWLRRVVYVELKAAFANEWGRDLPPSVTPSLEADKRLIHMPTPEMNALSEAPRDSAAVGTGLQRRWQPTRASLRNDA